MMTDDEVRQLLNSVGKYETTARTAIRQLVSDGYDQDLASELVLIALGGGDIIEVGADGRERYESGRLVADVEADMAR